MNGIIDGSSLLSTGLYSRQTKTYSEETRITGKHSNKTEKTSFKKEMDSVDISGASREIPQAGYTKPAMRISQKAEEEATYKPINSDGIQEGIELSDKAKNLLKELQDKYGSNMDIYVASWNSDQEEDYYANLSDKRFSALINPELLEKMANDDEVREKYESVLASATETSDKLKEELGEDVVDKIKSFTVSIDADGNVSYMVQLLKDFTAKNTRTNKELQEEQQERIEKRRSEEKARAKKEAEEEQYEKITANSLEDLIAQIKERYPAKEDIVITEENE